MHKRYTREKMGSLWDESTKFEYWLKVEIAAAQARVELGEIPEYVPFFIRQYARFDLEKIEELDKLMDHDMNAFLRIVSDSLGQALTFKERPEDKLAEEVLAALHAGLTSYDIEDTALALRLKVSADYILEGLGNLAKVLKQRAFEFKNTPQIGRTHLQHAEPITFGLKLLNWHNSVLAHRKYISSNRKLWEVGKMSGAVGTNSHFSPELEESAGAYLGLSMARASSQIVSREGLAYLMAGLANIATSLAKFAGDVEHLSSTEVQEVFESHGSGKTGSSAMPHKSLPEFANPNKSERIVALAKVVRSNCSVAFENIDIRHEQDLTQSASERIIIAGSLTLVDYMIALFTRIVVEMRVDTARMYENIWISGGLIFSQHVVKALMDKGMRREEARALVTRLCSEAGDMPRSERNFKQSCQYDEEVKAWLTIEEIEACFNLSAHLRNVDKIFERFKKEQKPS